jgi:hypothetical protein
LKALKYPEFTFDSRGFKEFFSIGALGKLSHFRRDKIFRNATRIKKGLRMLVTRVGENELSSVLNTTGRYYVSGFRLNAVTKFLAAYDPQTWHLFNKRVERVLDDFGYPKPHGFNTAQRYLAYNRAMEKFIAACKEQGCGELDALALDAFFLKRSVDLKGSQRKSKS